MKGSRRQELSTESDLSAVSITQTASANRRPNPASPSSSPNRPTNLHHARGVPRRGTGLTPHSDVHPPHPHPSPGCPGNQPAANRVIWEGLGAPPTGVCSDECGGTSANPDILCGRLCSGQPGAICSVETPASSRQAQPRAARGGD
ncbi:unnamed protein product [Merluccius merluccius]